MRLSLRIRATTFVAICHGLFPLLFVCTGCGQGEYDSRMTTAAGAIARRASTGPQQLAATHSAVSSAQGPQGLKLRFPTLFTVQTSSLDATKPGAKLMQADLAGFCYTMARPLADDAGKTIPVYCYLYAVPKAEADTLQTNMHLALAPVNASPWASMPPVKSPTGDIALKMTKGAGDMDFEVNGANERLPGQVEVYSFDAGANQVFIGWRAANSVATKHKFFEAVKASVASAQLDAPAAAAPPAPPMAPAAPAGS